MSLLKSREQYYTKAINNNNNNNIINMHANTKFGANIQQTKFPSEFGGVGGGGVHPLNTKLYNNTLSDSHRKEEEKKPFKTLLLTLLVSAY